MDRIHREARLDRLAQCPTGHDTRHYYKWLDEIDELTKQNAKLLEALKTYVSKFGDCGDTYEHARQAIAEAEGRE